MKRISYQVIFAIFLFVTFTLSAQSPNDILLTIGKRTITVGEFERIYKKNATLNTVDKQSVTDYFELFLKFKLKVSAALDKGLDTLSSFKKELRGYRDQLAKSYLTDNQAIDSLTREAYEHSLYDVNASHILVLFPENYTAADTLACYNKIIEAQKKLKAGESFESVAIKFSSDPAVKTNRGNLGNITPFRFPYLFERIAYQTNVGEISNYFRTNFGYHIIKVNDRKPNPGEIKVAHIMCKVMLTEPDSAWQKAKARIEAIRDRAMKGEDFGQLAKQVSDDRGTAEQGGELPWFTTGRMVPEFEMAAFALKTKGEISQPIRTAFGWHVIKLIGKRGTPTYDQVKSDFKARVMNGERADIVANSFVEKIKRQNPYKIYTSNLSDFHKLDSSVYKGTISLKNNLLNKPLLTIEKKVITENDFKKFLEANPVSTKKTPVKDYIDQSFNKFIKNSLIAYEDQNLETKYPDFGNLISEYHDGILLFDIMDREVWSKTSRDSAGLEAYYKELKNKPMWGERLDAAIVTCNTKQVAEKVKKSLVGSDSKQLTQPKLMKLVCDSTTGNDCLTMDKKLFSKGDNKTIDSIVWNPGIYDLAPKNNKISFIYVWEKREPEIKKLDDIRGLIIADYQNILEEKWVAGLKNTYKVVINQDLLHKIADKY